MEIIMTPISILTHLLRSTELLFIKSQQRPFHCHSSFFFLLLFCLPVFLLFSFLLFSLFFLHPISSLVTSICKVTAVDGFLDFLVAWRTENMINLLAPFIRSINQGWVISFTSIKMRSPLSKLLQCICIIFW